MNIGNILAKQLDINTRTVEACPVEVLQELRELKIKR